MPDRPWRLVYVDRDHVVWMRPGRRRGVPLNVEESNASWDDAVKNRPWKLPTDKLFDFALDSMTPPYPEDGPYAGQRMGPLDQFAHLATNTNLPPEAVMARLHRRIKERD